MKENNTDLIRTVWNSDKQSQVSKHYTVAEHDNSEFGRFITEWADRTPQTEIEFAEQAAMKLPISYNGATREWHVFNGCIWAVTDKDVIIRLLGKLAQSIHRGLDYVGTRAQNEIRTRVAAGDNKAEVTKAIKEVQDFHVKPRRPLVLRMQTSAGLKAALELLQGIAPLNNAQALEDDKNYLVFRNGVLDVQEVIDTGKATLKEHSHDRLCSRMVDFDLDLEATAPDWVNFLHESIPDAEEVIYLEKSLGCALFGERDTRRIVSLQGAPRSGKSTILDVMGDIFPMYSATPQHAAITAGHSAKAVANARFDMRYSRFTLFSEVRSKLDSDFLLGYSTIDKFTAEQKFKESGSYAPQGTIFIANNVPLNLDKSDPAMATRLAKVTFPQTFSELDPEHTMDRQLPQKLREQAPGIIARLVNAFILRHQEGIDRPESMQRELEAERIEDDVVLQFIEDMKAEGRLAETDAKPSNCVKAGALNAVFQQEMKAQGYSTNEIPKPKEFKKRVSSLGYEHTKSGSWVFAGLTLR